MKYKINDVVKIKNSDIVYTIVGIFDEIPNQVYYLLECKYLENIKCAVIEELIKEKL